MAKLAAKKTGFVYKPRTADQIKDRASRKNSKFDSIFKPGYDSYRPKPGDNLFRYLPPSWDDADHYGYTVHVHRNIGANNSTYLCPQKMLGKKCAVCEAAKEAKDAGESEEAKELGTSERIVSWVLDRDGDDPEKPLLYDQSWTQDRDIVSLCVNERSGEILMVDHPDNGYDITIKRSGTGMKTKYYGYAVARSESPIHDSEKAQEEILNYVKENPIPDTLNFYDYTYMKGVLSGTVAEKDEVVDKDEDEEEDVKPTARAGRRPTSIKDLTEDEEEEEEVKPARTRGPRRDEEVDEEVDEEEDEAPPPRRSARRVVEEPEDEEEEAPASRRSARRVVEEPEDEEEYEAPPPRRSRETAPPARSAARTRVVEEAEDEDEEEETPAPRRSASRYK